MSGINERDNLEVVPLIDAIIICLNIAQIRTLLQSETGSDYLCLVRLTGVEPATSRVGVLRAIQLRYRRKY
jgi:hypothetical protein